MIKLIKTPQRADIKALYEIKGDVLTVTMGEAKEVFDFTGFPEGKAESITPEILIINPIIGAEKVGDTVTVTVIEFYGETERASYEHTMEV